MTPEALALRPAVEALHKAGIRTGDDYDLETATEIAR